jgi:excinuclease ABC subunit A
VKDRIVIKGARQHNLRDISVELPRNALIAFTGVSGSGKSDPAFDTIFTEGRRRYVESLSAYARQFPGELDKPDADVIEGLTPVIAIDRKTTGRNPRSTVGTLTEVYDHLRLLYLSGRRRIPPPGARGPRTEGRAITVHDAGEHNLREVSVSFPLGQFVAVTGVSGSGRSTPVDDILCTAPAKRLYGAHKVPGRHRTLTGVEEVDKVVQVDRAPIGRSPRSNPATYTGVFDHLRKLIAQTPEAKVRGYQPGRFPFNLKGGRCEHRYGDGTIKVEMNFLPDIYVPCEVCHGAQYNRETLDVHFKGRSIADVLGMTIEDSLDFFAEHAIISRHLRTLHDVGLGHVKLGQPATTLSGGEAQRVKLASELHKRTEGRTLYVLEEPTTGLHVDDVRQPLAVLHRLVDQGTTVVVIEHDLDVIKTADWIVDRGPEGGHRGGTVIAEGAPEQVAAQPRSYTGQFLRPLLERS